MPLLRPNPTNMGPNAVNVTPYPQPANTSRASTVQQMYTVAFSSPGIRFDYEVGKVLPNVQLRMVIRNNSPSHDMLVKIDIPPYLLVAGIQPTTQVATVLAKNETRVINFGLNEAYMKAQTTLRHVDSQDAVQLAISPINVNGPVFVYTTLPPLVA
jgi:hypothetical protein